MTSLVSPSEHGVRRPLTVKELQSLTGKSRPWVYKAMQRGLIRYIWIGDSRRIPAEEADRISREGVSFRSANAPPPQRHRFPRKNPDPNPP